MTDEATKGDLVIGDPKCPVGAACKGMTEYMHTEDEGNGQFSFWVVKCKCKAYRARYRAQMVRNSQSEAQHGG